MLRILECLNNEKDVLSNICRATSGGYINFGCSKEVLLLGGSLHNYMVKV